MSDLAMGFPGSSVVKESACQCMRCKRLRFNPLKERDQEDPLKEEMATYCSFHAWRIPRTEEPDRLQSIKSQRVRHNLVTEQMAEN